MANSIPVLHQFRASHFNDKVRWALAFKGIRHDRVSYLPGLHRKPMQQLSGQGQVPVLVLDGKAIAGTAAIIAALEAHYPTPALYPTLAAERDAALVLEARFDAELGPATRTIGFTVLLDDLDYLVRLFAHGEPWLKRKIYRRALPAARGVIAKVNGVADPENVKRSLALVDETLDWIAKETCNKPYLVGERFSVADLAAAALCAPITELDHPDMCPRPPVPKAIDALFARYRAHPAIAWVKKQYRENRPKDAA